MPLRRKNDACQQPIRSEIRWRLKNQLHRPDSWREDLKGEHANKKRSSWLVTNFLQYPVLERRWKHQRPGKSGFFRGCSSERGCIYIACRSVNASSALAAFQTSSQHVFPGLHISESVGYNTALGQFCYCCSLSLSLSLCSLLAAYLLRGPLTHSVCLRRHFALGLLFLLLAGRVSGERVLNL